MFFNLVYTALLWFNRLWNRWKGFLLYVQKDLGLFVYCLGALTHPGEISHACTDCQVVFQWLMCEANSPFEKQDTLFKAFFWLTVTLVKTKQSQVTVLSRKRESERRGKGAWWECFSFPTASLAPSVLLSFSHYQRGLIPPLERSGPAAGWLDPHPQPCFAEHSAAGWLQMHLAPATPNKTWLVLMDMF